MLHVSRDVNLSDKKSLSGVHMCVESGSDDKKKIKGVRGLAETEQN